MICPHCGEANALDAKSCVECGAALATEAGAPAPVSVGSPSVLGLGRTRPGSVPGRLPGEPTETSGKAIGSLVCGIFFLIFPAAVGAIILGHLSLSDIRRASGRLKGSGMATAGLVLGYTGAFAVPFVLIVAAIAIPNLLRSRMAADEATAVGSLRTINVATITYAAMYGNGFAPDLKTLDGAGTGPATCDHAQLIDHILASGQKTGYVFSYKLEMLDLRGGGVTPRGVANGCTIPGSSRYMINADPITRGTTGQRSFYTDQTGVIRWSIEGPATAESPPLD
jgi:type IV pilus assembly protein PilA